MSWHAVCVSLCPWVALVFLSVDARLLFSFTGFMFEFCHGSLMLLGAALQYYFPKVASTFTSIIEFASFCCSRLIRTYSVVPSFEATSYHSPLFNASDHPWFFGSSLSSSMPEITCGFLGSLFSVMFLGLSSGCLLFVFSLLGSMFSFQFEGPSIC